jgi:NhaP-type Na+/H+ or K+/H+ antiporter
MYQGEGFDAKSLIHVPIAIVSGLVVGVIGGIILLKLFKKIHMRDTVKILVILSMAFLFVSAETFIQGYFPMSGLLAVMALGGTLLKGYEVLAKRLSGKFSKIWVGAEMLLFVLVGAAVDISYVGSVGLPAVLLIVCALIFRIAGVFLCLLKTKLSVKERLFCAIAYLPKATVQAAIGAIPLASGVKAGDTILAVAVLAIMITAPLGAIGVDVSYKKWLHRTSIKTY